MGRSALTAALGIRAARKGMRALVIAMTDQSGLAAHLRVSSLRYQPKEVRPGLDALAIDPAQALDEYLRLRLKVPRLAPMTRAFRALAETVPGVRDTVVMGKVLYESMPDRGWDIVISDGPPIGQISSFLRAPATIESLVPSGRVEEQAAWMRQALTDPLRSGLVLCSLAEELPAIETTEVRGTISSERLIDVACVYVNRVLPELDAQPPRSKGAIRDAAQLHQALYASQQVWLGRLAHDRQLPFLFGLHTPGEVAARLADLVVAP